MALAAGEMRKLSICTPTLDLSKRVICECCPGHTGLRCLVSASLVEIAMHTPSVEHHSAHSKSAILSMRSSIWCIKCSSSCEGAAHRGPWLAWHRRFCSAQRELKGCVPATNLERSHASILARIVYFWEQYQRLWLMRRCCPGRSPACMAASL